MFPSAHFDQLAVKRGEYIFFLYGLPAKYTWKELKDISRERAPSLGWVEVLGPAKGENEYRGMIRLKGQSEAYNLYALFRNDPFPGCQLRVYLWMAAEHSIELVACNGPPPGPLKHSFVVQSSNEGPRQLSAVASANPVPTSCLVQMHDNHPGLPGQRPNFFPQPQGYRGPPVTSWGSTPTHQGQPVLCQPYQPQATLATTLSLEHVPLNHVNYPAPLRTEYRPGPAQQLRSSPIVQTYYSNQGGTGQRFTSQTIPASQYQTHQAPEHQQLFPFAAYPERNSPTPASSPQQDTGSAPPRGIFIRGLNPTTTRSSLELHLRAAGTLVMCRTHKNPAGSPRGTASARFASPEAAALAVHLFNKTVFEGKTIAVRFEIEAGPGRRSVKRKPTAVVIANGSTAGTGKSDE